MFSILNEAVTPKTTLAEWKTNAVCIIEYDSDSCDGPISNDKILTIAFTPTAAVKYLIIQLPSETILDDRANWINIAGSDGFYSTKHHGYILAIYTTTPSTGPFNIFNHRVMKWIPVGGGT